MAKKPVQNIYCSVNRFNKSYTVIAGQIQLVCRYEDHIFCIDLFLFSDLIFTEAGY